MLSSRKVYTPRFAVNKNLESHAVTMSEKGKVRPRSFLFVIR